MFLWLKKLLSGKGKKELPVSVEPNFETCLLLCLEMLKRGARSIDMHPWGLRLVAPQEEGATWSVGMIPQEAQDKHTQSLVFGDPPPIEEVEPVDPDPNTTPIAGEEKTNEPRTAELGFTP